MRALLQTMHDLRDALEAAANGRRSENPFLPVGSGDLLDQPQVPKLHDMPLAERIEAQERADYRAEELEAEFGPLSRDASFDERWPPDFDDGATFDDADFQPITE